MAETYLEEWSRRYLMVGNASVRTWNKENALMDTGLYNQISRQIGDPVVGFIDGVHYQFEPSNQVFSEECVIPNEMAISDPALLVLR